MDLQKFFSDVWQFIQEIVGPIGGLAAIILGISTWIGNIWANRIVEKDKARYEKELELYRTQLDLSKSIIARYSEFQFESYNTLWTSLYDLKICGDALWEVANLPNLQKFSRQLQETKDKVGRMSLFIEEENYDQLTRILREFSEYRIGKKRLIDFRAREDVDINEIEQFRQVQQNYERLEEYTTLTNEIRNSFRNQLKLSIQPTNHEDNG